MFQLGSSSWFVGVSLFVEVWGVLKDEEAQVLRSISEKGRSLIPYERAGI